MSTLNLKQLSKLNKIDQSNVDESRTSNVVKSEPISNDISVKRTYEIPRDLVARMMYLKGSGKIKNMNEFVVKVISDGLKELSDDKK